jgi:hypothetical protein
MAPTRRGETDVTLSCCASAEHGEVRCACGSLLARWTPQGLELKCRRCKRTLIVPVEPPPNDPPR